MPFMQDNHIKSHGDSLMSTISRSISSGFNDAYLQYNMQGLVNSDDNLFPFSFQW